jgi:hypothetical protein
MQMLTCAPKAVEMAASFFTEIGNQFAYNSTFKCRNSGPFSGAALP